MDAANNQKSFKEQRIRKITQLYYSRPEVQKAIFDFSKDREISPRYFEGFGKRPDCFQYKGDIFEFVKKGATSFHCSEELWEDPLRIVTGMKESQLNELRKGWDLLIDIDSRYIDYSKISAEVIVKMLSFHGVRNIGIKFSGSKGFHIIVPWKAFPKEINGIKTSDMFPEWPRIVSKYIMEKTKGEISRKIGEIIHDSQEYKFVNKFIKGEKREKEVMDVVSPDIILVSSRHLFRMPYSLHEKTALSSIVLNKKEIKDFQLTDADPMRLSSEKIRDFMPEAEENEARELLIQALDWGKESENIPKTSEKKKRDFQHKSVKLSNLSDKNFPPCIKKILNGISDGKKRALFVLINLFRSIGMERDELEKRIYDWNKKNETSLKEGYIKSQISWSYRKGQIMPPNCKEFYQGIGVCMPDDMCKLIKNPVNYTIRKNTIDNKPNFVKRKSNKSNFR